MIHLNADEPDLIHLTSANVGRLCWRSNEKHALSGVLGSSMVKRASRQARTSRLAETPTSIGSLAHDDGRDQAGGHRRQYISSADFPPLVTARGRAKAPGPIIDDTAPLPVFSGYPAALAKVASGRPTAHNGRTADHRRADDSLVDDGLVHHAPVVVVVIGGGNRGGRQQNRGGRYPQSVSAFFFL